MSAKQRTANRRNEPRRLVRWPTVHKRVGSGRTVVMEQVKDGKFPQPVKISKRSIAWFEDEIDEYVEALRAKRDAASNDADAEAAR